MSIAFDTYVTYAEVLAEGLPNSIPQEYVQVLMQRATEMVEQITNNYFRTVSGTFVFDGNNSYLLHMPLPIISVTSLTINNSDVELDSTDYKVYNGRQKPNDDRKNPKIELRRSSASSIFTRSFNTDKFWKGYDQTVVGSFGYLEPDDSPPLAIKESVVAITIMLAETLYPKFHGRLGQIVGPVVRERTDDHEIEWRSSVRDIPNYIVPKYIQDRLTLYRSPAFMTVTNARLIEGSLAMPESEGL
jgi:hypothetical protein